MPSSLAPSTKSTLSSMKRRTVHKPCHNFTCFPRCPESQTISYAVLSIFSFEVWSSQASLKVLQVAQLLPPPLLPVRPSPLRPPPSAPPPRPRHPFVNLPLKGSGCARGGGTVEVILPRQEGAVQRCLGNSPELWRRVVQMFVMGGAVTAVLGLSGAWWGGVGRDGVGLGV